MATGAPCWIQTAIAPDDLVVQAMPWVHTLPDSQCQSHTTSNLKNNAAEGVSSLPDPLACVTLGAPWPGGGAAAPSFWGPCWSCDLPHSHKSPGPRVLLVSYPHLFSNLGILKLQVLITRTFCTHRFTCSLKLICNPKLTPVEVKGNEKLESPSACSQLGASKLTLL